MTLPYLAFLCAAALLGPGDCKAPTNATVVQGVRGYNSWPMVQAMGGRLVCSYSRDRALPADGHGIGAGTRDVYAKVSTDGGRTWSEEVAVAADPAVGEVNEGIGLDSTGAALAWVRCWGPDRIRRHELYRTADGVAFEKVASLRPDPFPMQVMDIVRVPGLGLVSPWFAGDYRTDGANAWGLLVSADDGRTWEQRTVECGLSVEEWVTEPSLVSLPGGRLLVIGRCERVPSRQFQVTSADGGRTWTKARTNIGDVAQSTPSLVYDPRTGLLANYYYHRGARRLKRRVVDADFIFSRPTAWPEPETLAEGFEPRAYDAGNVNVTRLLGTTDCCAWYTGTTSNATVVVTTVPAPTKDGDLAAYVDPFTGTAGTGHTHPSACVPFGMVQAGPDTGFGHWDYCSGYQYRDKSVLGYSLTHLSGTGCPDYNDVQVLPFAGEAGPLPMRRTIDKASETATPGYYRVFQPDDGVEVEVTAAKRAALYRFTWSRDGEAHVLLNLPFGQHMRKTYGAQTTVEGDTGVSGSYVRTGWIPDRRLVYALVFDRPWASIRELPKAAPDAAPRYVATFKVAAGDRLHLKAGLSMTDVAGAKGNLAADVPGWDFEGVRRAARAAWNGLLARTTCDGTDDQRRNWYTALYHLYGQPNDYADADGRYSAADGKVRASADGTYFTTLSLWDTFRAAQPWYTLATPEIVEPVIRSFLSHYRTFGRLPVMSYGGKNVDCMIGNHSVPVIADAYLKGFRGFDAALAFEAITNTLTVAHPGKPKENWDLYDRYGYFPHDLIRESVSRTLECAYDDWCAAAYARAVGQADAAAFFARRAGYWRNVFDPSIRFARGKDTKGNWRTPFDPYAFGHGDNRDNDFTEGNAFQYTWHVMQDVPGLVAAMGGREAFVRTLDALFTSPTKTESATVDISGMIGQYVHGNEPSHHVIYFYPQVGHPEKAAERIREVFDTQYHVGPEGLCGNDDCGQMSAWYVFSAMGFYPFNPCGGEYVVGAPQVPRATLRLADGRTFTMTAKGLSAARKYVKSVSLNGRPITDWKIRHADIVKGGELVFEMKE